MNHLFTILIYCSKNLLFFKTIGKLNLALYPLSESENKIEILRANYLYSIENV